MSKGKKDIPSKGALKILTYLAFKKYGNKYEIAREWKKLSYPWTHRLIKRLLKMNLIREEKKKREKAQTGLDKCFYTLTQTGLIGILRYESTYEMIDLVARNHAEVFPLVFGKWGFFIKENKRDTAIIRLKIATIFFEIYVPRRVIAEETSEIHLKNLEAIKKKWPAIERFTDLTYDFTRIFLARELIYHSVHLPNPNQSPELREWLEILDKDPYLKDFVDKEVFKRKEKSMEFELKSLVSWKNWWESLS